MTEPSKSSKKSFARSFVGWLTTPLRTVFRSVWGYLTVALLAGGVYLLSPLYWVTEAVYWESVNEPRVAQNMVRHVLANRRDHPDWPQTYVGVILDGVERGNHRDFTYRDHHAWKILPDWVPIPPLAHAVYKGNMWKLARMQGDTIWFLAVRHSGLLRDYTNGATFYKVDGHPSGYFARMESQGKICPTAHIGAHEFFNRCEDRPPVSLTGSPKAVNRAWEAAHREGFWFASHSLEMHLMRLSGALVSGQGIEHVLLADVSLPYVRPATRTYLERLAGQYSRKCKGKPLVVTSMLRFDREKLPNASTKSVHPAGMALDFRVRDTPSDCLDWLRASLLAGERNGYVDVTEEYNPPHLHVVVFGTEYEHWLHHLLEEEAKEEEANKDN